MYIWNDWVMCGDFVYVFAHLWKVICMGVRGNLTCTMNMRNIVFLHEVWSCVYHSMCRDFPPNFK